MAGTRSRGRRAAPRRRSPASSSARSSTSRRIRMPIACASARVDVGARRAAARSSAARRTRRAGMRAPCALEGARLPGGSTITPRDDARRRIAGDAVLGAASSASSDDASGLLALPADAVVGTDVRDGARARRHADHDQAHAEPRRLPVARSASRARSRRSPARRSNCRRSRPRRSRRTATRGVRVEDAEACPRFCRAASSKASTPRAPTPAWMKRAPRAQRASARSPRSSTSPTT